MDTESILQYLNKQVILTLTTGFWYKAVILEVTQKSVTFTELKGRKLSVSPDAILIIQEVA